jgi:hypothetical protein
MLKSPARYGMELGQAVGISHARLEDAVRFPSAKQIHLV